MYCAPRDLAGLISKNSPLGEVSDFVESKMRSSDRIKFYCRLSCLMLYYSTYKFDPIRIVMTFGFILTPPFSTAATHI